MNSTSNRGLIFNIQKFSLHDGAGIRTLVFMKGCPLKCKWCSNPESQGYEKEIIFFKEKCIKCGKCLSACTNNATHPHTFAINRQKCVACDNCSKVCVANAKKHVGEYRTVADVMAKIEQDRIFYRNSNGGITIGGGEPLAQPEFVYELLKQCKVKNIHTAIETCGFAKWERVYEIFNIVDHVFYDLKCIDENHHKTLTGVSNQLILNNAYNLANLNKDITFRLPLIPGCNDDEENLLATGEFVKNLAKINSSIKLELLEYHALGENKYIGLDRYYSLKGITSDINKLNMYRQILRDMGIEVI